MPNDLTERETPAAAAALTGCLAVAATALLYVLAAAVGLAVVFAVYSLLAWLDVLVFAGFGVTIHFWPTLGLLFLAFTLLGMAAGVLRARWKS